MANAATTAWTDTVLSVDLGAYLAEATELITGLLRTMADQQASWTAADLRLAADMFDKAVQHAA